MSFIKNKKILFLFLLVFFILIPGDKEVLAEEQCWRISTSELIGGLCLTTNCDNCTVYGGSFQCFSDSNCSVPLSDEPTTEWTCSQVANHMASISPGDMPSEIVDDFISSCESENWSQERRNCIMESSLDNIGQCFAGLGVGEGGGELELEDCRGWWDIGCHFRNALKIVANFFINLLLKLFLTVIFAIVALFAIFFSIFTSLAIVIFNAVIEALLMVPVTTAGVVLIMWGFVRDFVNLFFILFFVVIGLATILKIESYQYKRALAPLIIMALLVNFSLVLVGLIVDIGNILTSLFLSGIVGKAGGFNAFIDFINNYIGQGFTEIWSNWGAAGHSFMIGLGVIANTITLVLVSLFAAQILWILIFVFLFRIAILWLLAIVSPLAFVSYAFPVTKRLIWDRWLKNLINWAFIAVPVLFFVFIGFYIAQTPPSEIMDIAAQTKEATGTETPFIGELIEVALTPVIALLIMFLGLIISMTLVPEGAQAAIDTGKKSGAWILQKGRRTAPVASAERRIREGLERSTIGRAIVGERGTFAKEMAAEKKAHKERLAGLNNNQLREALGDQSLDRVSSDRKRAAIFDLMTERGHTIPERDFERYAESARRGGASMSAAEAQNPISRVRDNAAFERTISSMKPSDFAKMDPRSFQFDPSTMTAVEQERQARLIERMSRMNERQVRKVSEDMPYESKRHLSDYLRRNSLRVAVQARAAGRSNAEFRRGLGFLNTHLST